VKWYCSFHKDIACKCLDVLQRKYVVNSHHYFVYFIASEGLEKIKIGITQDIKDRISSLRCDSPCHLYVLGFIRVKGGRVAATKVEKQFHQYFEPFHSHGEWFELNAVTRDLIVECVFQEIVVPKTKEEALLREIFEEHPLPAVAF
jgi:Meiotically up-regulated gene 113